MSEQKLDLTVITGVLAWAQGRAFSEQESYWSERIDAALDMMNDIKNLINNKCEHCGTELTCNKAVVEELEGYKKMFDDNINERDNANALLEAYKGHHAHFHRYCVITGPVPLSSTKKDE